VVADIDTGFIILHKRCFPCEADIVRVHSLFGELAGKKRSKPLRYWLLESRVRVENTPVVTRMQKRL